ncbi:hypothetical protein Scel_33250 [Streptomyces cellostaticus]|nr:hypothetical protein Scel_33250 [Streptomyces cellostaticus]
MEAGHPVRLASGEYAGHPARPVYGEEAWHSARLVSGVEARHPARPAFEDKARSGPERGSGGGSPQQGWQGTESPGRDG